MHKLESKYDVYIGRPSIFGNPFKIGPDGNRQQVVAKFKQYFYDRLQKDKKFKGAIDKLKGKTLACWCVDKPVDFIRKNKQCHGEIILEYLNEK